jgi:leucyl-tRNA synthetase
MFTPYDPSSAEVKWRRAWADARVFDVDVSKAKDPYYLLVMFPYPSGAQLHVGHWFQYSIPDSYGRFLKMRGKDVFHPMGFDAFGLPAENYAIKNKVRPQDATAKNVANFTRQMRSLGLAFDWSREVNTTDPEYFKWTQWQFLQFVKQGMAHKAITEINWCPKCKIGLANEEAQGGVCERCGSPVEKREKSQWMISITDYAERLIKDLDKVDYLEKIKAQQKNWIGKSEGATIRFATEQGSVIEVFTTRPDTLFGVTYVVLAPEHALVDELTTPSQRAAVEAYRAEVARATDEQRLNEHRPKTGVWTGGYAINPANNERVPVWVADYVLATYGTGAVMAVPAHDERDFAFAQKFGLPIKQVIEPILEQSEGTAAFRKDEPVKDSDGIIAIIKHWSEDKYLGLYWPEPKWGTFLTGGIDEGFTPEQTVLKEILEETGYKNAMIVNKLGVIHSKYYHEPKAQNRFGHAPTFYVELQDDERDRVSDDEKAKHETKWLTKAELRDFLTATSHLQALDLLENPVFTGDGILANSGQFDGMTVKEGKKAITNWLEQERVGKTEVQYKLRDWIFSRQHYWGEPIPVIHCSKCGVVPVPEDQLPVELPDVEAYEPTETGESPLAAITDWVNVDCPKCGSPARRETDTMPNWAGSSWYYLRYIDPQNDRAFADPDKLKYWLMVDMYNGGMEHTTLHLLYSRFWHKFLFDQGFVPTPEPYAKRRSHGMVLAPDGNKMSKSKGNVINPDQVIAKFGADSLRLYEMFMGPYDQAIDWSDEKLAGINRFLNKVWDLGMDLASTNKAELADTAEDGVFEVGVDQMVHKTLKKVDERLDRRDFNTMVSALMELINYLNSADVRPQLISQKFDALARRILQMVALMLAPSAPHMAEELWAQLGNTESVHLQAWPKYDPGLVKDDVVTIIVQVNGKLRGEFVVETGASREDIEREADIKNDEFNWTADAEVIKTIVVPGKLVNFVTK